MKNEEQERRLNALMTEYSQLKADPANRGKCAAIKNQAANIIYSPELFEYLKMRVKEKLGGRYTYHGSDEFITNSFFNCINKYDHNNHDNFYAFFLHVLLVYKISDGTSDEKPDKIDGTIIEDDKGNEIPILETLRDESACPERIAEISSLQDLVGVSLSEGETISEDEANIRIRLIEFYSKLIPCIIQAKEHRGNRDEYYRAFATDFYISACKLDLHSRYEMNENEAFNIMDLDFADWVLVSVCRSFSAFESTPCKTYAEIGVTGKRYANGEIETPFKNGVFAEHFKITESAIIQHKNKFHEEIGILVNEV